MDEKDEFESPRLVRKAGMRSKYQPHDRLRVRFDEEVKVTEYENEKREESESEKERNEKIINNLFENNESNNKKNDSSSRWSIVSSVTQATKFFANIAKNSLSNRSDEVFFDSNDHFFRDGQGSDVDKGTPTSLTQTIPDGCNTNATQSYFKRNKTTEVTTHSPGCIYMRPLSGNELT